MRIIGIPVADRPECLLALEVAFNLGKSLGADVEGYHIRPQRDDEQNISIRHLISAGISSDIWPLEEESKIEATAISAKRLFEKMAQENDYQMSNRFGTPGSPRAVYREKVGSPNKLIPLFGPTSDLLIVSRPEKTGGKKASIILMSSLLQSTTPILVLPQKKISPSCKRIAIAWNRGRSEALLLRMTMNLLKQAEDVVLITEGSDHQHGPSAREMSTYLKAYGVKVRNIKVNSKDTGKALVAAAKKEKADVLMAGAYTRGRTRELIFGGVTEHLLMDSDFPVILMHL